MGWALVGLQEVVVVVDGVHVARARDKDLGDRVSEQLAGCRDRDRADACDLARASTVPAQGRKVHPQVHEGLVAVGPVVTRAGDQGHEAISDVCVLGLAGLCAAGLRELFDGLVLGGAGGGLQLGTASAQGLEAL